MNLIRRYIIDCTTRQHTLIQIPDRRLIIPIIPNSRDLGLFPNEADFFLTDLS